MDPGDRVPMQGISLGAWGCTKYSGMWALKPTLSGPQQRTRCEELRLKYKMGERANELVESLRDHGRKLDFIF